MLYHDHDRDHDRDPDPDRDPDLSSPTLPMVAFIFGLAGTPRSRLRQ